MIYGECSGAEPTADLQARPPLTTALREQLGIKAERRTEPIEVIVIASASRPTID